MFRHHLPPITTGGPNSGGLRSEIDYRAAAAATEGYSGADIKLVCKEAAMRPVRKIFDLLEAHVESDEAVSITIDTITTADVETALTTTKPSARGMQDKYTAWQKEFESA